MRYATGKPGIRAHSPRTMERTRDYVRVEPLTPVGIAVAEGSATCAVSENIDEPGNGASERQER